MLLNTNLSGVAGIARDAPIGHHAGVAVSTHGESVRETHAVLLVETSGDKQYRVWLRTPRARVERDPEVDVLRDVELWCNERAGAKYWV